MPKSEDTGQSKGKLSTQIYFKIGENHTFYNDTYISNDGTQKQFTNERTESAPFSIDDLEGEITMQIR